MGSQSGNVSNTVSTTAYPFYTYTQPKSRNLKGIRELLEPFIRFNGCKIGLWEDSNNGSKIKCGIECGKGKAAGFLNNQWIEDDQWSTLTKFLQDLCDKAKASSAAIDKVVIENTALDFIVPMDEIKKIVDDDEIEQENVQSYAQLIEELEKKVLVELAAQQGYTTLNIQ